MFLAKQGSGAAALLKLGLLTIRITVDCLARRSFSVGGWTDFTSHSINFKSLQTYSNTSLGLTPIASAIR